MIRTAAALLASTLILAAAERNFEFWPGATYDPAIPTLKKIAGHDPGERITPHRDIVRYMEALAAAAPDRVKVFDYGTTWQGRRLIYVAIGSEANIRRLSDVRAAMKRLADPRITPDAEAKKLIAGLPAVVWLGYGVHGDEISSPDAAMLTAYHLLASRKHALVDEVLRNAIVLIDPAQNPDGRDRFIHSFEQNLGLAPDPSPLAAEHVQPWPGGRTNHYNFDMNRDWFAMTQPETRGRVKALLDWYPLVFVDLHEMGSDATYYFAPEAVPYNPHLTRTQTDALEWFGRNNARWFDQYGFPYFTREVYDAFYPGYGASWPSFYGSVAMTYEQASARGLVMRRTDETVFHFRDTVRQHFVASLSTCETAAKNREKLLANFYDYRRTAIEEGKTEPVREYVLVRRGDTSSVDKLAVLLADQGVEVKRATTAFTAAGKEVPAGSYLITLAQPAKRLIRTLLDLDVPMSESFVKEQERRRARRLPNEIYDVTAWSLPLLYNVEMVVSAQPATVAAELVRPGTTLAGRVEGAKADVAWLVPWGTTASGRFLTGALRRGLRIHSSDKPFVQNGLRFPGGTLIVSARQSVSDAAAVIADLAKASGAEVIATTTGWVEEGVNFGSRYVVSMRPPAIALAWDRPTSPGSAGHTRYVLERQFGYPVSVVRTQVLAGADLSRFQVLILPDSFEGYMNVLGPAGAQRLKQWVSAGGTLIGYSSAMSWMADPRVGLLAVSQENLAWPDSPRPDAAKPPAGAAGVSTVSGAATTLGAGTTPAAVTVSVPAAPGSTAASPDGRVAGRIFEKEEDYLKAIRPASELPHAAAGVLLRAKTDPDHWLTAGVAETVHSLMQGRNIFTPVKLDKGVNAAVFPSAKELLASGYLWEENRKQLAWKPLVVVQPEGRGVIIGFSADPNFRAYQDGMNMLFLNAVFRGPAHARPAASAEE